MQTKIKTEMEPDINNNGHWFNRNVLGMGLTSFLSDASHEMATSVLPGFLATIGAPASALGIIEGLSDAVASFVKLWSGWFSDKLGHRKIFATAGYFLTGISKALFAFAYTWHLVLIGRTLAWLGRGFRGPIRDAMLSDSVDPKVRGKAFGFHRAGDTLGAILGPLLGVWFLSLWQNGHNLSDQSLPFRNIFLLTLIPGILSALMFAFMVVEKRRRPNRDLKFWGTVRSLPPGFRKFLYGVGIFGIGDFAPTLLILAATYLLSPEYGTVKAAQIAGLMYVVRNVTYAAASYPIGALSDKIERRILLAFGYLLAFITIGGFIASFILNFANIYYLFFLFALAGIYIAAEDTLEGAITADYIHTDTRGIGMGVLGTVNGIGDFIASAVTGLLWTSFSPAVGFGFAALMMLVGFIVLLSAS
ncbi:MAG TPA: MFS transporter [Ignavibacteriales bacterium]|nr:MFS transporter [Ignavibacteriales bacterium]